MIKPTVGRVVWFYQGDNQAESGFVNASLDGGPLAAIIAHVWTERMVNLTVFDSNGTPHSRTSVQLVQDGDAFDKGYQRCEWMPYQKGQAAKTEALEAKLAG